MRRAAALSFLCSCAVPLLVAGCGGGDAAPEEPAGQAAAGSESTPDGAGEVIVPLLDAGGAEVGTVVLSEDEEGTQLSVEATGLPPGFHGFHVHAVGVCEPDSVNPADPSMTGDFLSAGGHLGAAEADHGQHAGDLPALYVDRSGFGDLETITDGFTLAGLSDADGSAVMVHAGPDNYANVPERYAPGGPDATTLGTGDAGGRIACGVVGG